MQAYTREEVASHNSSISAWIIIDSIVYDVTKFAPMHPGGELLLLEYAGKDVTKDFYAFHRQSVLRRYPKLQIGKLVNETQKIINNYNGNLSLVPYAEPSHLQGFYSPYYSPSHRKYRLALRKFFLSQLDEYDLRIGPLDEKRSFEVFKQWGANGVIAALIGPGEHLTLSPDRLGEVAPNEFDYFHEMVLHEEVTKGFMEAEAFNHSHIIVGVSTPCLLNFGNDILKERYLPTILSGSKRLAIAITEPFAGSDVAKIRTRAVKSSDGKFYIVNGVKKWITGGPVSDYFATLVRTGDTGTPADLSVLFIERSAGLETKRIETSANSDTAYVSYENVRVPVENLLGTEGSLDGFILGMGFLVIMYNFNHERWIMIVQVLAMARVVVEECFKWANQREVFGKKLIDQPVIRNKLAHMVLASILTQISELESIHSWTESLTYQMTKMTYIDQAKKLAGPLSLAKLRVTRVLHNIMDEAVQIFGGRGITKTGMGTIIEKFSAILGGSEEILADLGIRQAMRKFPEARL